MTHRVGTKGQVVIPKEIRDRLGLTPGTAVAFDVRDDAVRVRTAYEDDQRSAFGGRFADSGMAARLLADRAAEPR